MKSITTYIKEALNSDIQNWLNDVYETNKNTVRLMLTELEFENNKTINKQKPLTFDDIDEKGNYRWTLEHIMPQTIDPNSGWLETLNPDSDLDDDQVKKLHKEYVHKLGNLTFSGYNTELSNKSFIDKRDHRDKNDNFTGLRTELFLNESIADYGDIAEKTNWTIHDIDRRSNVLSKLLIEMYKL